MRHRNAGKQLSRNTSHRRALLRNMTTSLLKHEQIETTDAKAKSIRPIVEKMITLSKRGDLHARRQALAYLQDKAVAHKLFEELRDRYLERQGGYVRIIKKGIRKGDGAPVSIIQLLPKEDEVKAEKKKAKARKSPKASAPSKQKKVADKPEGKKDRDSKTAVTEKELSEEKDDKLDATVEASSTKAENQQEPHTEEVEKAEDSQSEDKT